MDFTGPLQASGAVQECSAQGMVLRTRYEMSSTDLVLSIKYLMPMPGMKRRQKCQYCLDPHASTDTESTMVPGQTLGVGTYTDEDCASPPVKFVDDFHPRVGPVEGGTNITVPSPLSAYAFRYNPTRSPLPAYALVRCASTAAWYNAQY
eukprot:3532810-Rhodomonas_salina.6